MKTGFIYMIENLKNGKKYIGQTVNIKRRWYEHKNLLNNNKHINNHLQQSWNKNGEDNFKFKIIEKNIPLKKLDKKEINYISQYNTFRGKGYNLTPGGKSRSGKDHPMYGKCGEENPFYGHTHTKETLEKLSKQKTGSNHPYSKISQKIGVKIYKEYHKNKRVTLQKLAKKYDTNRNTVSEIKNCKHWTTKHLKEVKSNV